MIPRRTPILTLAVATLALAALSGCHGDKTDAPGAGAPPTMTDLTQTWTLRTLEGRDLADWLGRATAQAPTMTFAPDGRVSGFAGVNRYSGKVAPADLAAGRLDLAQVISTKMAGPPEQMRLESAFLSALQRARTLRTSAGELILSDGQTDLARLARP